VVQAEPASSWKEVEIRGQNLINKLIRKMNITKTPDTHIRLHPAGRDYTWLVILWGLARSRSHAEYDHELTTENGQEVWTCSMHPSVREDGPGSCPICGMDLIPPLPKSEKMTSAW
jgi:rubrerythrin